MPVLDSKPEYCSVTRTARALVAAVGFVLAPGAFADSLDELRGLVGSNDSAAAWSMAQRMEPEASGDPEFDFWYGLAAKSAGKKNQALFAFERVVLAQPDNPRAKLELADIHYQFGNVAEAKVLFDEVLSSNPPEPVQQRIRTYLGAMEAAEQGKGTRINYVLGLAGGYDSNIGSATDIDRHDYILPGFVLLPQSLATDAAFIEARAGIDVVAPVNQRTLRFLSVSAQRRDNEDIFSGGNFDNSQLSLTGGWMLRRGSATWRIPVGVQALWGESVKTTPAPVNDDRFLFTVGAEYNKPLTARTAFSWFGRLGESHYPSEPNRNAQLALLGVGYNWSAASAPVSVMSTLHIGTEPSKISSMPAKANGRDYLAARVSVRWSLRDNQSLYGSLGLQDTQYQAVPPISTWGDREDLLVDLSLGWQSQLSKQLAVNAELSMANNDSLDNKLFDFDRTQVKLGSTWRF